MHGAASAPDYYPRSHDDNWKSSLTMHLQEMAFGSRFRTSIEVAAFDPRVERSVLGDSAGACSGVVGIDGAGIYEPLYAGSQRRFGDFPRDAYLVALVI